MHTQVCSMQHTIRLVLFIFNMSINCSIIYIQLLSQNVSLGVQLHLCLLVGHLLEQSVAIVAIQMWPQCAIGVNVTQQKVWVYTWLMKWATYQVCMQTTKLNYQFLRFLAVLILTLQPIFSFTGAWHSDGNRCSSKTRTGYMSSSIGSKNNHWSACAKKHIVDKYNERKRSHKGWCLAGMTLSSNSSL